MAQRVEILLEDDIDGGEAVETISFGLEGVAYEIDLNEANAAKLRESFSGYVEAGRKVSGRRRAGRPSGTPTSRREELGKIRAWARENGYEVADRGRISASIREAYAKAKK